MGFHFRSCIFVHSHLWRLHSSRQISGRILPGCCIGGRVQFSSKANRKDGMLKFKPENTSLRVSTSRQYDSYAEKAVAWFPESVQPYLKLIRADKPVGTWLLYWPCAWSITMAAQPGALPDPWLLGLFGVGAFLMRGTGCIVNDIWDRDFDHKVERTRDRPITSGHVSVPAATGFLASQLGLAALVLLQLNWTSVLIGASSLALVGTYPLFKRFTYYPQAILGLTFSWGAILGYAAVRGVIDPWIVLPLYFSGFCWTMIYDTIYAHQDNADDALIGVKSTALKFGERTSTVLYGLGTSMLFGLGLSGCMANLAWPFYLGLFGAAAHLIRQISTLKIDDPSDCARKFRSNHSLGFLIFCSILMGNIMNNE